MNDMVQKVTNYVRFYTLLNRMPYKGDKEDLKRSLVSEFSHGRTGSIKDVTWQEYNGMCAAMERMTLSQERDRWKEERRRARSVCLKLMQQIGVDTTNWNTVNRFCISPKIAGGEFRELDVEDLGRLSLKLRMILRKQSK